MRDSLSVRSLADDARSEACITIVEGSKLAGSEAFAVALGQLHVRLRAIASECDEGVVLMRAVAHLDLQRQRLLGFPGDRWRAGDPSDGLSTEMVARLVLRVVVPRRVQHVRLQVLVHHMPRAVRAVSIREDRAEPPPLAHRVEPQATVSADVGTGLIFDDGARALPEVLTEEVVVIELPRSQSSATKQPVKAHKRPGSSGWSTLQAPSLLALMRQPP